MRVDRRELLAGAVTAAAAAGTGVANAQTGKRPNRPAPAPIGSGGDPTQLSKLAEIARERGGGDPVCIVDLAALDSNTKTITDLAAANRWTVRPALKAFQSPQLCAYVLQRLPKPWGMVFNLRYVDEIVRRCPPHTDLLCGWQPTKGELAAYLKRKPSKTAKPHRVRLLADSVEILEELVRLAATTPRRLPLDIALDLDSGMGRGGFDNADELRAGLDILKRAAGKLRLTGVVCYDGHATLTGEQPYRQLVAATAQDRLRGFLDVLRTGGIDPAALDRNGPASNNYRNWAGSDLLSEVSPGSAFLRPGYLDGFDVEGLRPAVFQSAPISRITGDHPSIPLLQTTLPGSTEQEFLIKLGPWNSAIVYPGGIRTDELSGGGNSLVAPKGSIKLGDHVIMRPQQSGDGIDYFDSILAVREGVVVREWPTIPRW